MNKTNKTILAIVIVIIVAGAAIILFKPEKSNAPGIHSQTGNENTSQEDSKPVAATITYNGQTFTSTASSVNSGDSVRVFNDSDQELDFDSDPHPVHTDNPELNAGRIDPGQSKTFTLTEKGAWGYHNHLDASQKGQIDVR